MFIPRWTGLWQTWQVALMRAALSKSEFEHCKLICLPRRRRCCRQLLPLSPLRPGVHEQLHADRICGCVTSCESAILIQGAGKLKSVTSYAYILVHPSQKSYGRQALLVGQRACPSVPCPFRP